VKSRFLSDVGHELRTPLTSMINLSRILLDRADGPLTEEQEHQVRLIHRSAGSLTEMVNDLLDLAKIEAGKTTLRRVDTTATEILAALRGMFRPLVENAAVALVIEEPADPIALQTDDVRLSQILRNFVSNAIKFTETGEVRVRAAAEPGDLVRFDVTDTGIGIAPEDQARIFEEFTQVDSSVQRRVRGTGLGLPLARKLAHMLGGRVELSSALGKGSTFSLVVPRTLPERGADGDASDQPATEAKMTGQPRE
jgi:signal transduction histidine kinase